MSHTEAAQRGPVATGPRVRAEPFYTSSPFEPVLDPVERLDDIDLTDPELYLRGDPHAAWLLLRNEAPVFWHEKGMAGTDGRGFWAITHHEDFMRVLRDSGTFSSTNSPLLDFTADAFAGGSTSLANLDPPRHTQLRRLIQRFITPRAVAQWEGEIRGVVDQLVDRIADQGECDFARDVALHLPASALAAFIGLNPEQNEAVAGLNESLHNATTPEELGKFTAQGLELFESIIEERRDAVPDDIVGAIMTGEIDGSRLDHTEVLFYLWQLFIGGLDTTVHAANSAMLSLFHHPDQLALLEDEPLSLGPVGTEELLRWTSVSQHLKRRALKDTVVAGQPVAAGDYVVIFQPSANRDAAVHQDPFRLDLRRPTAAPATFGHGTHLCPGLHLARLELRLLFEGLFSRLSNFEQTGPAVRGTTFTILLSPIESLPVAFRRR